MKTKLIVTILACAALLAAAVPASATEPLPTQLEYIDAQLDVFLPKLAAFQADYYATNSQYYQALGSHSYIPTGADGADLLTGHPTDQDTTLAPLWEDTGLPSAIAWSFTIGTYVSPQGAGYVLTVCTIVDLSTWCRTIDAGPDGATAPWAVQTTVEE